MLWACLSLIAIGAAVSVPVTAILIRLGSRLKTFDSPGVTGQVKAAPRRVPNTGGIAIVAGIAGPMLVALAVVATLWPATPGQPLPPGSAAAWIAERFPGLAVHAPGISEKIPDAMALIMAMLVIHTMGLFDDRRPMKAIPKLAVMVGVAASLSAITGSRLLTALDDPAGGPWLSYVLTVAWMIVVMNAMNFLDNMDGLSGGVCVIAGCFFLASSLVGPEPQWFVAACLSLLIGAVGGFLAFNAPLPWSERGARIFMGDGGSLSVGLLLGFLTVRTTYADLPTHHAADQGTASWFAVFMPILVLAIPLYDFSTVVALRLRQGKSPLVGDLQHVSHRLARRGLSRRGAVYVLWALTAATSCGAVALRSLDDWRAALVVAQTLMILGVLFAFEHASRHAVGVVPDRRGLDPDTTHAAREGLPPESHGAGG